MKKTPQTILIASGEILHKIYNYYFNKKIEQHASVNDVMLAVTSHQQKP